MPIGRMLNKKISYDEELCSLSLETILIFTWIIPHLDVKGRIFGDAAFIKAKVFPLIDKISVKKIEKALAELLEQGLIIHYGTKIKYIEFTGFVKNQKINEKREAKSTIPEPDLFENSGVTPELIGSNSGHKINTKIKNKVKIKIKDKEEEFASPNGDASELSDETITSSNEKKIDFIDEVLEIWKQEYEKSRNMEYEIMKGKDRSAVGKLVAMIRRIMKRRDGRDPTREEHLHALKFLIIHALQIDDAYYRNNLTPMLLYSKFNEIKGLLKNGNKSSSKLTDNDLREIAEREAANIIGNTG